MNLIQFLILCFSLTLQIGNAQKIEKYTNSAAKQMFQLAPNGKTIAYIETIGSEKCIMLHYLRSDSRATLINLPNTLEYFYWKNDQIIIYAVKVNNESYLYALFVYENNFLNIPFSNLATIIDELPDNDSLVMLHYTHHPVYDNSVLYYNVYNTNTSLLYKNKNQFDRWKTNTEHQLIMASKKIENHTSYYFRSNHQQEFIPRFAIHDSIQFIPVSFSSKSKSIRAISDLNSDKLRIIEYAINNGNYAILKQDSLYDIVEFSYDVRTQIISTFKVYKLKKINAFIDSTRKKIWNKVSLFAQNENLFFMGVDEFEIMYLLKTSPSNNPGTYYLYNKRKDSVYLYHPMNPFLNDSNTSKVITYRFTYDNNQILNYYYKPIFSFNDTLLIYYHHTGRRIGYEYNAIIQAKCALGYQILIINGPGTTGLGKAYQFTHLSKIAIQKIIEHSANYFNPRTKNKILVDKNLVPLFQPK